MGIGQNQLPPEIIAIKKSAPKRNLQNAVLARDRGHGHGHGQDLGQADTAEKGGVHLQKPGNIVTLMIKPNC